MSGGKARTTQGPRPASIPAESFSPAGRTLFAFGDGQAGVYPIGPEIIREVHDLPVGESHGVQRFVSGLGVGAFVPRTATAIQHDQLLALQRRNPLAQQFQAFGRRARARVAGERNPCLFVKILEAHVQYLRTLPDLSWPPRLLNALLIQFRQRLGLDLHLARELRRHSRTGNLRGLRRWLCCPALRGLGLQGESDACRKRARRQNCRNCETQAPHRFYPSSRTRGTAKAPTPKNEGWGTRETQRMPP